MQLIFIPKILQKYQIAQPGFIPVDIRKNITPISDTFERQQRVYSDEEKLEILKKNEADSNLLFHALNYNNIQFEHAIKIFEKHKDKTPLELDCLINYSEKKFRYILQFLDFGINPFEIKNLMDMDNNHYKIVFEELNKINGLSENYKNKTFDIHVAIQDKQVMIIINWLQDGENIANKENLDARKVVLIKHINENGEIDLQKYEASSDDFLKSRQSKENIVFDTKIQNDEIQEQFEISNEKIVHKKLSDILQGIYDITSYDFKDYDECIDIKEGIRLGELQGTILSKTTEDSNGTKIFQENYDGIKRKYTAGENNYSYSFKTPFMDFSRSFSKISDKTTKTIVNNREYFVEFDDKNQTIKINGEKIINIGDITDFNPDLWKICKTIPGDILNHFDIVRHWELCDNLKSYWQTDGQILATGDNLGVIAHEMGHAIDKMKLNIYNDSRLMKIFNKEKENYCNKYTFPSGVDFMYHLFDEYEDAKEMVAETNSLLINPGNNICRTTRSQILAHHFPETIGYITQKLTSAD